MMTTLIEKYRKMEPRELDALVAEKVMGWKRIANMPTQSWFRQNHGDGGYSVWKVGGIDRDFSPSSDPALVFQVAEAVMQNRKMGDGCSFGIHWNPFMCQWIAKFSWADGNKVDAADVSPAMATTLAALVTLELKESTHAG